MCPKPPRWAVTVVEDDEDDLELLPSPKLWREELCQAPELPEELEVQFGAGMFGSRLGSQRCE